MALVWRALCLLGLVLSCAMAQADEAVAARIDKLFAAWDRPDSPGAALLVLRDGQVLYRRGYGQAQLEHAAPITPATVFHVASVSKQFTAFAVHLLAQDGKLSLDDELRKHVPEMQVAGPPITLRHLLHHTSGLRDQWNLLRLAGLRMDDHLTEGDILTLLFQQRALNFAPGDEELYSNSGYSLLALVVQRGSGQRFAAFMKERVFVPLGMAQTHVHDDYSTLAPGRAASYVRGRDGWRQLALSYSNVGATSVFTTVDDLARWDRNFDDARVGGPAVQAAMLQRGRLTSGREIAYASGLVLGRWRGQPVVEHSGVDAGYRAHFLRLPQQRLTVLLLGNAGDINSSQLSRRVAEAALGDALPPEPARSFPPEVALAASALQPFVGAFEMRPGFVLTFSADGNRLSVQATGQPKFTLFASADNQFFMKTVEAGVRFDAPGADGRVDTATWRQNDRDLPLRRLVAPPPLTAEALQGCTGDYYSEELRTLYRLDWRDNQLRLRHPRGMVNLVPSAADRFSAPFPFDAVVLQRQATGGCESLTVSNGRVRDLRFLRVRITPAG